MTITTPLRSVGWLLATALLSGCGTMADPFEWFDATEVVEPSPLVELENKVQPDTLWSRDVGAGTDEQRLNLAPRVVGDTVYVADAEGTVQALAISNGATRWEVELDDVPVSGGPGVGDGMVLLGTSDAEVIALNADDGELRWQARVSSEVLSAPAAANGVVVVHTVDGKLFGLESTNGNERWRYEREVPTLTLRGSCMRNTWNTFSVWASDSTKSWSSPARSAAANCTDWRSVRRLTSNRPPKRRSASSRMRVAGPAR